jgi:NADPH:quinone reductase-like Zn-dependent oxidoreductase
MAMSTTAAARHQVSRRAGVAPGHEVVGGIDDLGEGGARFAVGDRVGVPVAGRHRRDLPVLPARPEESLPGRIPARVVFQF